MKVSQILFSFASLAAFASASPINETEVQELQLRGSASNCYPAADPHCCVPTHCRCANGWIYQFNRDNIKHGGNGCDPPWGYIGLTMSQLPGYCCK